MLEEAHGILAELQSYNGAGQEIREVRTDLALAFYWFSLVEKTF